VARLAEGAFEWRSVGDEVVVLNTRTSRYLTLNGSASLLWPLLLEGSDDHALASCLVGRYGVSVERAEADVRTFLAQLKEHGLLRAGTA
jgi:roadblock/LC7 domain-containing protein